MDAKDRKITTRHQTRACVRMDPRTCSLCKLLPVWHCELPMHTASAQTFFRNLLLDLMSHDPMAYSI